MFLFMSKNRIHLLLAEMLAEKLLIKVFVKLKLPLKVIVKVCRQKPLLKVAVSRKAVPFRQNR